MNTIIERVINGKFTLIAEIGVNYYDIAKKNGINNIDAAKMMVKEAKKAGIHAVKFQTYKADTLAAHISPSYWDLTEEPTTSQRELFKKFDSFGFGEYKEIKEYCDDIGIEFLSTPFDYESADYLYELMNVYKISSSDLSNIPFIEYQAQKGKSIILSIGASNEDEIELAVNTIRKYNNEPLILMHCVLEYPTPYDHANLLKIQSLKEKYKDVYIGYSDHTKPDGTADIQKIAFSLGALIIEKHFTLDKTLAGNDHYHAMDSSDAKMIIDSIQKVEKILGRGDLKCLDSETKARENARRSLVSNCYIEKGVQIEEKHLTTKRPGTGISPVNISMLIGKRANRNIDEDEVLLLEWFD